MKTKAKGGGGFNISTALVLLLMLCVVVIALLTQMLYETEQNALTKANETTDAIYCIPVTPAPIVIVSTPTPVLTVTPTISGLPTPTREPDFTTVNPEFGQ